jgi:RimJ/RimL family protein N-acetyltransferase
VILETERLLLRPWRDADRTPLAAIFADPEVKRFYPGVLTAEETSAQIDAAMARAAVDGFGFYAAELKQDGRLAGWLGISRIGEPTRSAIGGPCDVEIGWQLDKTLWGRGLAPEGARAWLAYGFGTLALPEIVAFTFRGNLPSRCVMEKIGMRYAAASDFDHPRLAEGHPLRPHVVYRISRPA